ncbi:MAG: putative zinc-binding peptidase [Chitinophagaceae bacterium]
MKLYTCSTCENLLYFENSICLNCNSVIGFDAGTLTMHALEPAVDNVFTDLKNRNNNWRFCTNAAHKACNWIIPADSSEQFCPACNLNKTIPFLEKPENLFEWQRIEVAKHRLLYSLSRLRLPVEKKQGNAEEGLIFEFLEDNDPARKVITQHDNGRIELNINEADEAQRVKNKLDLGERYRTLLGHFRHEIGHYYWDVFYKKDETAAQQFRDMFGDERIDYNTALQQYYANGPAADWNNHFISQYATSHAWEDWAETWAHYLHLMDTLETAYSFGIALDPRKAKEEQALKATIDQDPYSIENFDDIIALWIPLTFAVNSLNRSMGHPDFYPFVIAGPVIAKLKFIHDQVKAYKN